jgi:Fe-S-cluster containining protein
VLDPAGRRTLSALPTPVDQAHHLHHGKETSCMSKIRTEFGFERNECDCEKCIQYCLSLPGNLIPADLDTISAHLGYDDLAQFAVENLLASPGAIVSNGESLIRIPTLVPQRRPDGACKFLLHDNRCAIHAHAPYSCAFFHAGQDPHEAEARSLRGLRAIAREWSTGGLYARLWIHLFSLGLVAPSPVEARERMRRELRLKKNKADSTTRS